MGRAKGKGGYMLLKIDLEKAYDKLEWSFIRGMFRYNFPDDLIKIIMNCISSILMSLLFNGGSLEPFRPFRVIRQGGPLSLYIFILCMEFLGQLIQEKCETKVWCSVKAPRSGHSFSHLFFADDLVLLAKANAKNCSAIREVLDTFCRCSRQTVSDTKTVCDTKSRVYFSPNINQDDREAFSDILGFHQMESLRKYLGFPIKETITRTSDLCWTKGRVSLRVERPTFYPWSGEQF